jgi:hypothetical protein
VWACHKGFINAVDPVLSYRLQSGHWHSTQQEGFLSVGFWYWSYCSYSLSRPVAVGFPLAKPLLMHAYVLPCICCSAGAVEEGANHQARVCVQALRFWAQLANPTRAIPHVSAALTPVPHPTICCRWFCWYCIRGGNLRHLPHCVCYAHLLCPCWLPIADPTCGEGRPSTQHRRSWPKAT